MSTIVANNATTSESSIQVTIDEISTEHLTMVKLAEKLNEVIHAVNTMGNRPVRDRGPKSTRNMTREDAWRVKFGDLTGMSHKDAATLLGLSYGQIYSCREDYTMKNVTASEFSIKDESKTELTNSGGLWDDDEQKDNEEVTDEAISQLADELETEE